MIDRTRPRAGAVTAVGGNAGPSRLDADSHSLRGRAAAYGRRISTPPRRGERSGFQARATRPVREWCRRWWRRTHGSCLGTEVRLGGGILRANGDGGVGRAEYKPMIEAFSGGRSTDTDTAFGRIDFDGDGPHHPGGVPQQRVRVLGRRRRIRPRLGRLVVP